MSEALTVPPYDPDLVVYRGEFALPGIDSIMSWGKAIYFGTQRTANIYAEIPNKPAYIKAGCTPRVYPCRLIIHKLFINQPKNPFLELDEFAERFGVERAVTVANKFSEHIEYTNNWTDTINPDGRYFGVKDYLACNSDNVKNLYFTAYRYLSDDTEIYWLQSMGYDGAIHQGSGHGSAHEPEYCVFDERQIKPQFV